ncbi:MAG: hypothetical protein KDD47_11450 [Acidobacteria bacterium]|nr:hypothetical protein [Acidobacteriota bacterium]
MYGRQPGGFQTVSFGFGGSGPPPRDVLILLAVVFVTFSLRFFEGAALIPHLLELSTAVYRPGFVWQIFTYPFIGMGTPSLWFLLELLILFWFARDTFRALGQKRFWRMTVTVAAGAALAAVVTQVLMDLASGGGASANAFLLMQGQRMLLVIYIAAFATLFQHASILLFFVLPVQARWFLWLEILFGFMGFLGTRDLAGFVGICTAVFLTWSSLQPGGLRQILYRWRLRLRKVRYERELGHMKDRRGFHVVKDDGEIRKGPWVN